MPLITVAELIGLLQQFPSGYRVVVEGQEGGYSDICAPEQIELDLNVNAPGTFWMGPHQKAEGGSPAVLISGWIDESE